MEKRGFFIGVLCIVMGLTLNEYLLTALISEDGVIESSSRLKIWVIDGIFIGLGMLIILSRSFRLAVAQINIICNYNFIFHVILTGFIAILLFAQMSYIVSAIHENQDNHGIVYSTDPDAGTNIKSTLGTTLFSASEIEHGILYQRIARFLAWWSPVFSSSDTEREKTEKRVHFSLVLISLFSMYLISFLLASLVSNENLYKILGTLLISAAILNGSAWCNYVLRVHPDMLLTMLSALFLFLIYRSGFNNNSKYYGLACIVAGACLSTKPVFFLFLPGLIFIEIPPVSISGIKKLIRFYLFIAVSYFVLSFPLFVSIIATFKRLVYARSTYSTSLTWDSFIEWWSFLIEQGWLPLVMVIVLFLVFGKKLSKEHQSNWVDLRSDKYFFLRLWAVAISPFILLSFHRLPYPHVYYTLPFVSILLSASAVSLPYLSFGWVDKIRSWFSKDLPKYAMAILMLISFEMTIGIIPENVGNVLNEMKGGREDARATYKLINSYADNGKKVLVEAYIPFRHGQKNIVHGPHLSMTLDKFKEYEPDIVAVNVHQMPRVMEGERPNEFVIIGIEDTWKDVRKYYGLFYKKKETIDPWGRNWIKIYEDSFGVQLWEKDLNR